MAVTKTVPSGELPNVTNYGAEHYLRGHHVRPLDGFPTFYGTWSFNTEFTRALHLFLSWARPIQATSPHPTSPRSILILSKPISVPLRPHLCYMTSPSHPLWLDYSNYTWQRVQIMKLLVMKFSPFSRHLIPLWSKYPPLMSDPKFHTIQNHRQNYSLLYSNVMFFDSRWEERTFWTEW
jgi:hypothetical protein